jgi:hypothetical protein
MAKQYKALTQHFCLIKKMFSNASALIKALGMTHKKLHKLLPNN